MVETEFPETPKITSKTTEAPSRNLPWVEKYRPQKLTDLISHADILGESLGWLLGTWHLTWRHVISRFPQTHGYWGSLAFARECASEQTSERSRARE